MARIARSIAYGTLVAAIFPALVMLGMTTSVMIFGALAGGPGAGAAVAPFSIFAVAAAYADYDVEGVAFGAAIAALHYFRLRWLDWRLAASGIFGLMIFSRVWRGPDVRGPGAHVYPETVVVLGVLAGLILAVQWWVRRDLPRERPAGVSSSPRMTAGQRMLVAATYVVSVPILTSLPWFAMELLPFPRVRGVEVLLLSSIAGGIGAILLALLIRHRVSALNAAWTQAPGWSLFILGGGNEWDQLSMIAATSVGAAVLVTLLVGRQFERAPRLS